MRVRERILVGVPTITNRITIQVAGLMDALRVSSFEKESAFDFDFVVVNGKTPVEHARNVIVGEFLKSDCSRLWFIDEDMLPHHSAARLLHSDADIICARMHKFDHPNPEKGLTVGLGLCAMMEGPKNLFHPLIATPGQSAVQDVDVVGTACTIFRRHVLEDRRLWNPNVYTTHQGETIDGNEMVEGREFVPAVFQLPRTPAGMPLVGEDVDFCIRAKALGYSIQVDLNAVCGHFKAIDIDQAGFLAQEVLSRAVTGVQVPDGRIFGYTVKEASEQVA